MQLRPHEIALGIILGEFDDCDGTFPDPRNAFTRQEAIHFLEDFTGEPFGDDGEAWKDWFLECPEDLIKDFYEEYFKLQHSVNGRYFKQMKRSADERFSKYTKRKCPNCDTLCPEFREICIVCHHRLGRE